MGNHDELLIALPSGTELVGDYRIERVLGAGGFGITYLAEEIALARLVTIKEYFPGRLSPPAPTASTASPRSQECAGDYKWGLDRFIEEAQTLARFVHPNIVRVYRYFRANNTGYMVLHFEEGGSFKSWLKGLERAPAPGASSTRSSRRCSMRWRWCTRATSCIATSPPTTSSSARTARRC